MSGTYIRSSRRRKPSESTDQRGVRESRWADAMGSEWSDERMSERSFSTSMMMAARRAGISRKVARRDDASCSCVKTGRRLVGFMLA